jgi:hypothetical protein
MVVVPGTLIYLYRRNHEVYVKLRNTVLATWLIAMPIYALFPVAPPRLAGIGMLDTITSGGGVRLDSSLTTSFYNPLAAVPSLHAGFALAVGVALAAHFRNPLAKLVSWAWAPTIGLAVVATGNHFFFDIAAGIVVTIAGYVSATRSTATSPAGGRGGARCSTCRAVPARSPPESAAAPAGRISVLVSWARRPPVAGRGRGAAPQLAACPWARLALGRLRAHPEGGHPRRRDVLLTWVAGAGASGVLSARGGDALRIVLLRRRMTTTCPRLVGTLAAETVAETALGALLTLWALSAGLIPGLHRPGLATATLLGRGRSSRSSSCCGSWPGACPRWRAPCADARRGLSLLGSPGCYAAPRRVVGRAQPHAADRRAAVPARRLRAPGDADRRARGDGRPQLRPAAAVRPRRRRREPRPARRRLPGGHALVGDRERDHRVLHRLDRHADRGRHRALRPHPRPRARPGRRPRRGRARRSSACAHRARRPCACPPPSGPFAVWIRRCSRWMRRVASLRRRRARLVAARLGPGLLAAELLVGGEPLRGERPSPTVATAQPGSPAWRQSAKRTRARERLDVGEHARQAARLLPDARQLEPGRVDDDAAAGERDELAPGGRVAPAVVGLADRAGRPLAAGQGVEQAGLADAGGAQQHAGDAGAEQRGDGVEPAAVDARDREDGHRAAQCAADLGDLRGGVGDEVGLGQHHDSVGRRVRRRG